MSDNNPVNKEVETFDKRTLKKTHTEEKCHLPTTKDIEEEKSRKCEGKHGE